MSCGRPGHMISAYGKEEIGRVRTIAVEWNWIVNVVVTMFTRLQSPFNIQTHSRGVRLEDIKLHPYEVMPKSRLGWESQTIRPFINQILYLQYQPCIKRDRQNYWI